LGSHEFKPLYHQKKKKKKKKKKAREREKKEKMRAGGRNKRNIRKGSNTATVTPPVPS
jgi:hypothetical protein